MGLFSNIFTSIKNFFVKEQPIVENALAVANNVVNIVKTFLGSATGQTIEAIIEALAPGVSSVVFGALNTFFTDFGLVTAEISKTPAEIAADGLNALSRLTGDSKTIALSNVSAIIGNAISSANNGGSTLQQAIVAAPVVYNPAILNTGGSPVTVANTITNSSSEAAQPEGSPNA